MKLQEIIETNELPTTGILIEKILPYKKILLNYYQNLFSCEPLLMVTNVFNACQYGKIVPANEFNDALYEYLGVPYIETDENEPNFDEDLFGQYETICFNSIPLSKL